MDQLKEVFNELVVRTLTRIYEYALILMPRLIVAVLILLVGWICAVLIKKLVSKLLRSFGFDAVSEKTGISAFLKRGGVEKNASLVVGMIFYWIIIFSALGMVFNMLKIDAASQFASNVILYIPKTTVALILLALGIYFGQLADKFVSTTARLAKIPFHQVLGKLARYAIIGLVVMMALEELNVTKAIAVNSFIIFFGVIPIAITLIFVIGGRDIIANILARSFVLKQYRVGDKITVGEVNGEIKSINTVNTSVICGDEEIAIPNAQLLNKVIHITRKPRI